MNKLVRRFGSLILAVESFNLLGLGAKGKPDYSEISTYVKINRQEQKSGHPIPLYRNENNELVDIFGTVLSSRGVVLKVNDEYFNEFPLWDKSKSPLSGRRSDEKILEVLSKLLDPCLGRNEKNELISIKDGQKVRNMNHAIIVPETYYANFPVISVDMSKELYEYLDSPSVDAIKSHQVYRNKYNRLVDEFGNGLKYDGKFIRVPSKYLSKIPEHPWVEGVRNGKVFLDSWDDYATKVFKVVNENRDLIHSNLSISCKYNDPKKNGDWGCGTGFHYNERPNCIDIPLLDKSEENIDKYNKSLKYEKDASYDTSSMLRDFARDKSITAENDKKQLNKVKMYDEKSTTVVKDNHTKEGSSSFVGKALSLPLIWLLSEYISQLN